MATSISLLVVLAVLAVSTGANDIAGVSSVCDINWWQRLGRWRIPPECCGVQGRCEVYIDPKSERYGLKNDRSDWRVRLCSCETETLKCIRRINDEGSTNPSSMKFYFTNFIADVTCLVHKSEEHKIPELGSMKIIPYKNLFDRSGHPDHEFVRQLFLLAWHGKPLKS